MKVAILAEAPGALIELCGVSMLERLLRTLQRVGVREAVIVSSTAEALETELATPSRFRTGIAWTLRRRPPGPVAIEEICDAGGRSELLLVLPGDAVWDDRLLTLLLSRNEPAALVDSAPPQSVESFVSHLPATPLGRLTGAAVLDPAWLSRESGPLQEVLSREVDAGSLPGLDIEEQPSYSLTMRRELRPLWIPAPPPAQRKQAEQLILDSAQKGSLDLPAWVHGPIETTIVARLCKTSITPNQLTAVCNVVAWAVVPLFATGHLIWGTALALAVGILDGLDGKQARVKVETTEAGKLEHWLDTFYELAWLLALAYYFHASGALPDAWKYLLLFLAAEGIDGLAKLSIIRRYGRLIDELSPLDRKIRFLGGRRNVYIWILAVGVLLGAPAKAFVVMVWWEAATAVVHVVRAIWAIWIRPFDFATGK
ncbi:MAG TPA: CDP-alcohol phosphatidyltransferase family protein [Chthoniobacterales bacterium]|nr:CDP-alcohol phosphatidyltransferase family protein [Chthoniobacterales bacterium]